MKKGPKHTKPKEKRTHAAVKTQLHPRSKHRQRYDFASLIKTSADLAPFVKINDYGDESIDFFNPQAVKALNKALLMHHYGLTYWDISPKYLCPPIPGRADYIHYIADVLAEFNGGEIPTGPDIKCLDIGMGANCIYPLIGHKSYGWSFVGSDIDPDAVVAAEKIMEENESLSAYIDIRFQEKAHNIFKGIIQPNESFDLSISNPPFHASEAEAIAGNTRKIKNLKGQKTTKPSLNFSGHAHELWCEGGEVKFVGDMIRQSKGFSNSCCLFSSLVAKEAHLDPLYRVLDKVGVEKAKILPMGQGNKKSRILVWTFFDSSMLEQWKEERWRKASRKK